MWVSFDQTTSNFQFIEDRTWIEGFVNYKVGIDGISILFIILTTFITPLCIISVNNTVKTRLRDFFDRYINNGKLHDWSFLRS